MHRLLQPVFTAAFALACLGAVQGNPTALAQGFDKPGAQPAPPAARAAPRAARCPPAHPRHVPHRLPLPGKWLGHRRHVLPRVLRQTCNALSRNGRQACSALGHNRRQPYNALSLSGRLPYNAPHSS